MGSITGIYRLILWAGGEVDVSWIILVLLIEERKKLMQTLILDSESEG